MLIRGRPRTLAMALAAGLSAPAQQPVRLPTPPPDASPATSADAAAPGGYSLKENVRRVVVDVVVTDAHGEPKRGLTRDDFFVEEDGKPQRVLSFDSHDKDSWTTLLPPNLPANTFINLPREPERGPLYVLLYDMVNTGDPSPVYADSSANIFARQQLVKFLESKPQGTRFAILAISDGLHLIQGFTSDRQLLLTALDPQARAPHTPKVFLYSGNYRFGDPYYYLAVMKDIAEYLKGLPGRKNLIWVSRNFPFAVFADNGPPELVQGVRKELTEMAASQIAIYTAGGGGVQAVSESELAQDEVARETGGHAFFGGNDLAGSIEKATDDGEVYYTLSYSSTDKNYTGKLRHIEVKLAQPGYRLAYRRQYYADVEAPVQAALGGPAKPPKQAAPSSPPDTLFAYIRHGMPESHDLLFSAHVEAAGAPKIATPAQMADLAEQPAYFRKRRKDRPSATLPPVPLQSYVIEYGLPSRQFPVQPGGGGERGTVEFAAAAYTAEGVLLNGNIGHVGLAAKDEVRYYRAAQQFEVPVSAAWMCLAVRDPANGRIGNLELALPLPQPPRGSAAP